jgi:hypothetical protein
MGQGWEREWQVLVRRRDEALARSQVIQAEITAAFRRHEPPSVQLLRAADLVAGELATTKARLKDFLHQLGSHP